MSARRITRLTPLAEALALLASTIRPVDPQRLPLREAIGAALAADLVAAGDLPAGPVAVRDGWAVSSADLVGASPYAPVQLAVPLLLESGMPLPVGADAVLPPHELAVGPFGAEAMRDVAPGEGTAGPGDELAAGGVLRRAGERVRPQDAAVAALLGRPALLVRRPRVAVLVIGTEIADGRAEDALGPMLAALIGRAGAAFAAETVPGTVPDGRQAPLHLLPARGERLASGVLAVPDDAATIAALVGACRADLVLVTGGTGVGESDVTVQALEQAGTVLFHGVAARPGTTAAAAIAGGRPVLALPGRLEDCLGAALVLARPLLDHMAATAPPRTTSLPLARKLSSSAGFAELALLRRADAGAEPLAIGRLPLEAIARADGYHLVPAGSEGYDAGTRVPVLDI